MNFINQAAQGDMLITKVGSLPNDLVETKAVNGDYILTHSETGHNHVVSSDSVTLYGAANDPFMAYMVVEHPTTIRHLRSFDTHSPITVNPGVYRINRQREYTPEGFRRAAD